MYVNLRKKFHLKQNKRKKLKNPDFLRVGAYFVLRKIIEEYNLKEILSEYFEQRDLGLFLDLAVYSIIAENNAAQYYLYYTYNHSLFTNGMKQYSDSKATFSGRTGGT